MKVIYTNPAVGVDNVLSSDLFVDGPGNNDAYGHVELDVAPGPSQFSGPLTSLRRDRPVQRVPRDVNVTCDQPNGTPCAWDGTYSFTPPGHDQ